VVGSRGIGWNHVLLCPRSQTTRGPRYAKAASWSAVQTELQRRTVRAAPFLRPLDRTKIIRFTPHRSASQLVSVCIFRRSPKHDTYAFWAFQSEPHSVARVTSIRAASPVADPRAVDQRRTRR
jgi:hypothetical protein